MSSHQIYEVFATLISPEVLSASFVSNFLVLFHKQFEKEKIFQNEQNIIKKLRNLSVIPLRSDKKGPKQWTSVEKGLFVLIDCLFDFCLVCFY